MLGFPEEANASREAKSPSPEWSGDKRGQSFKVMSSESVVKVALRADEGLIERNEGGQKGGGAASAGESAIHVFAGSDKPISVLGMQSNETHSFIKAFLRRTKGGTKCSLVPRSTSNENKPRNAPRIDRQHPAKDDRPKFDAVLQATVARRMVEGTKRKRRPILALSSEIDGLLHQCAVLWRASTPGFENVFGGRERESVVVLA